MVYIKRLNSSIGGLTPSVITFACIGYYYSNSLEYVPRLDSPNPGLVETFRVGGLRLSSLRMRKGNTVDIQVVVLN